MRDGRSQRIGEWLLLYGVSVLGALVSLQCWCRQPAGSGVPFSLRCSAAVCETLDDGARRLAMQLHCCWLHSERSSRQADLINIGRRAATCWSGDHLFRFVDRRPGAPECCHHLAFRIVGGAFWASLARPALLSRGAGGGPSLVGDGCIASSCMHSVVSGCCLPLKPTEEIEIR